MTVMATGPLLEKAVGRMAPPESRGSVPSSVKMTELPALGPGLTVTMEPLETNPPSLLIAGRGTKLVSMKSRRLEYQNTFQSTSF